VYQIWLSTITICVLSSLIPLYMQTTWVAPLWICPGLIPWQRHSPLWWGMCSGVGPLPGRSSDSPTQRQDDSQQWQRRRGRPLVGLLPTHPFLSVDLGFGLGFCFFLFDWFQNFYVFFSFLFWFIFESFIALLNLLARVGIYTIVRIMSSSSGRSQWGSLH
jgi:hypothetical protein